MNTTGSPYVNAIEEAPDWTAFPAKNPGSTISPGLSSGEDWEICQFWQKRHVMLQPTVERERAVVPGRKW
jgi:hypothetical protein